MFKVISLKVTSLLLWDLLVVLHLPRFDLLDLGAFLDVAPIIRSLRRWHGGDMLKVPEAGFFWLIWLRMSRGS